MTAQVKYDDVEAGTELGQRTFRAQRIDLVRYCGASGDFNVIHWNERIARSVGLPDVIAHGMFTMAQVGRYVTDWAGDPGAVLNFSVRFSAPVVVPDDDNGATIEVSGKIEEKLDDNRVVLALTARSGEAKVLSRPRGRQTGLTQVTATGAGGAAAAQAGGVPPGGAGRPRRRAGKAGQLHDSAAWRPGRYVRRGAERAGRGGRGPRRATQRVNRSSFSAAAPTSSSPMRVSPVRSCTSLPVVSSSDGIRMIAARRCCAPPRAKTGTRSSRAAWRTGWPAWSACPVPRPAGATPIQNVGAYGQEVAETITRVRALDRTSGRVVTLDGAECGFGYRTSMFKRTPGRFVILDVTSSWIPDGCRARSAMPNWRRRSGRCRGRVPLGEVREAVLELRRGKAMVLDPADPDSRSAGSFFTNPVLGPDQLAAFEDAARRRLGPGTSFPRFPASEAG